MSREAHQQSLLAAVAQAKHAAEVLRAAREELTVLCGMIELATGPDPRGESARGAYDLARAIDEMIDTCTRQLVTVRNHLNDYGDQF